MDVSEASSSEEQAVLSANESQSCLPSDVDVSSTDDDQHKKKPVTIEVKEREINVEVSQSQDGLTVNDQNTARSSRASDGLQIDSSVDDENKSKTVEEEEDMDSSRSEMSDFSDGSQEAWHPVQGPVAWVHEQMRQGQSARSILEDLVPPGTIIPEDIDPMLLWRLIINIVSEPPKRKKLENINTLEDVVNLMTTCKKIIVLTGAGVSVSCGIPDFRSRDGVYARLAVDFPNLPDPQAMFDIHFFRSDPRPFFKFAKEIYPGQFKPSPCHHFIRVIESHGKLLRNYTQNIDTLEQEAGIERVIQCHGSFATATCTNCKLKVKSDVVKEDIFKQVIPRCSQCPEATENAIMKPDIVFFGESLPEDFHRQMAADKDECDLLIVIGSSLKVRPVALIPNSLPAEVPQILINRERLPYFSFDVELLGNCDEIVAELCHRLGSGWNQLANSCSPLTEVAMSGLLTPPVSPPNPLQPTSSDDLTDSNLSHWEDKSKVLEAKEIYNETSISNTQKEKEDKSIDQSGEDVTVQSAGIECRQEDRGCCNTNPVTGVIRLPSCQEKDCDSTQLSDINKKNDETEYPQGVTNEAQVVKSIFSKVLPEKSIDSTSSSVNKVEKDISSTGHEKVTSSTSCESQCPITSYQDDTDNHSITASVVSSSTNEPNVHSKHHHHHPHHHKHHHHKHGHHHHHQHNNHHHHHQHHHSPKKSVSEHNQEKDDSSNTEPVKKRAKLELLSDGQSSSNVQSSVPEGKHEMEKENLKSEEEKESTEEEVDELRKMWQAKRNRISLAQRLPENQYLYLPPNRYVFKGAEVFSDEDKSDSDSEEEDIDEEDEEHDVIVDDDENEEEDEHKSTKLIEVVEGQGDQVIAAKTMRNISSDLNKSNSSASAEVAQVVEKDAE